MGKKGSRLPAQCDACERKPLARINGVALCNMHWQRVYKHGELEPPKPRVSEWRTCTVDGCEKPSRTRKGALCEMHYTRRYRNGHYERRPYKFTWQSTHGYALSHQRDHPMATSSGLVYVHRQVLYDAIGTGPHKCGWCGKEVEWKATGARKLVVDHLDGDKTNNNISNLVASCHTCNSTRGLFMKWVEEHRNDPVIRQIFERQK